MSFTSEEHVVLKPDLGGFSADGSTLRFLTEEQVCEKTTLSRTLLWKKVATGEFPEPFKVSQKRIAWFEHEVNEWMLARKKRSSGHSD